MYLELKNKGFQVEAQKKIKVYYKGIEVGEYYADLIVENLVILELKAVDYIVKDFENQILNYLRSTECEVGLLLNFGKKPEFKQKFLKIIENKKDKLKIPLLSVNLHQQISLISIQKTS